MLAIGVGPAHWKDEGPVRRRAGASGSLARPRDRTTKDQPRPRTVERSGARARGFDLTSDVGGVIRPRSRLRASAGRRRARSGRRTRAFGDQGVQQLLRLLGPAPSETDLGESPAGRVHQRVAGDRPLQVLRRLLEIVLEHGQGVERHVARGVLGSSSVTVWKASTAATGGSTAGSGPVTQASDGPARPEAAAGAFGGLATPSVSH